MSRDGTFTPFDDQKLFMESTGQIPCLQNAFLYMNLISEEYGELVEGWNKMSKDEPSETYQVSTDHLAEIADACVDILYVTIGMLNSLGLNGQELWNEVQRSNMSKLEAKACPDCGGVGYISQRHDHGEMLGECPSTRCRGGHVFEAIKREDGKILKPASYSPPKLVQIVARNLGR